MAKRWTKNEEFLKHKELKELYLKKNMSIGQIAEILNIAQSTVYDRLLRLGIKSIRSQKEGFNNKRLDISIPRKFSKELSEFIGIMLGDGHLTSTQVAVTLGNKEESYVNYVSELVNKIFKIKPKILRLKKGYFVVYFGSTEVVRWLLSMGLVFNKVRQQVDVPVWIFSNHNWMEGFLRGFFDTDGSVYKLKFGIQIAFTNRSLPMLKSIHRCLTLLDYNPSKISLFRVYLTRKEDVNRFFTTIGSANLKHQQRFEKFSLTN